MFKALAIFSLAVFASAAAEVVFKEEFSDSDWQSRWVESTFKGAEAGHFDITAGKFYGDAEKDKGLHTTTDARFYAASAKFDKSVSNEGKTLVIQFTVKHEQNIDCGGGYVKLFDSSLDQKQMHGDSPYLIMFGPDICGYSTKKVHVIFNYKGKNLLIKKEIRCKDDVFTHLYTLIVKSDNTYEVLIDNEKAESGSLDDDWDFLAPKKIKDPAAKKPDDWDENEEIEDPSDTKPADWDKPQHIPDPNAKKPDDWEDNEKMDDPEDSKPEDWEKPEFIPDPDAKKPDDWDEEMDGQWAPAKINNPEYKGEWKAKQIDNPKYKGPWIHPEIDNPDYVEDENLYRYTDIGAIGFDLWQVKSGTIFDNILLTDDEKYAEEFGTETWGATKDAEKKMKERIDEEDRKKEEDKRKEEEAKKAAEEAPGEEATETDEEAPKDEL
jgi:calreticulin